MSLDYLAHLREDSARFAAVLRDAPADGQVPTCPDWRADDLLWHLGEVQWFWGTVVRDDVKDPDGIRHPDRPPDRGGLLDFFDEATTTLQESLMSADPSEHRWTWAEEQTVGFIRRRQAHEALIHRVDAELTADKARAPLDAALASDGVDEVLRVMLGGHPAWGRMDADPAATLLVRCRDTDRSWQVTIGSFSGTAPDGRHYAGQPTIAVAEDRTGSAAAAVEGAAADLDCWLWGRPTVGALHRSGDEDVHARFQQIVGVGIE